jgi:hypothetical protein
VIPDIDIGRGAKELIKQYGDLADIEAAARADEFEAKGERDGQRVWLRIAKAIDELRTANALPARAMPVARLPGGYGRSRVRGSPPARGSGTPIPLASIRRAEPGDFRRLGLLILLIC